MTNYPDRDYTARAAQQVPNLQRNFTLSLPLAYSLQLLSGFEKRPVQTLVEELLAFAVEEKHNSYIHWVHWKTLTRREQEVVVLLARGYSNQEIARSLVISLETAKTHVRNVLHKFSLHRRDQLRLALANWDFKDWEYLT